jgi:hypothetical protein
VPVRHGGWQSQDDVLTTPVSTFGERHQSHRASEGHLTTRRGAGRPAPGGSTRPEADLQAALAMKTELGSRTTAA